MILSRELIVGKVRAEDVEIWIEEGSAARKAFLMASGDAVEGTPNSAYKSSFPEENSQGRWSQRTLSVAVGGRLVEKPEVEVRKVEERFETYVMGAMNINA